MMGAIGTGNVREGRVTVSLGTSGTIYAYAPQPVIDPSGEIAAFCDSTDAWLPLLCTMNVTVATEKVRRIFGWTHSQFDEAATSIDAGSDGLLFLPYLQGERTPNLPNARGSLHGLTLQNYTPAHLARATMEGVTLGMAYGMQKLCQLGIKSSEIRLIGGGSQSPIWRSLCADIFGAEIVSISNAEGAALGAAIQALSVIQTDKNIEEWADLIVDTRTQEKIHPNPEKQKLYTQLLHQQTALTKSLFDNRTEG